MAAIGVPTPSEPVREMLASELVVRASTAQVVSNR
jgi:hypothetical protein